MQANQIKGYLTFTLKNKHITQEDIANALNVSQENISRVFSCENKSEVTRSKVAKYLGFLDWQEIEDNSKAFYKDYNKLVNKHIGV